MKYLLTFIAITFSTSLSAKVMTFDCVPDAPKREGTNSHRFVVDLENKTWEWKDYVFDGVVVSPNAVSVKGFVMSSGDANPYTFSVSRVDLTYKRRVASVRYPDLVGDYTGKCEIVEDKVERAF